MAKFIIKQNDTSPSLEAQLLTSTREIVSLVGATVVFNMKTASGTVVINRAEAEIVDASSGIVRYDWFASDTARAGEYLAEFEVTFADGKIETFPQSDKAASNFIAIVIPSDAA